METLLDGLRAAAEATRLRILALCAKGELSVSDLTTILGQSQPRVSRHLKLLVDSGLVDRYREGTFAYFRVADQGPGARLARPLLDLLPQDDPQLARDEERLEAIKGARREAAASYFRENAEQWDRIRALHIADADVEAAIAEAVPDRIDGLLDLGTGTGRMLELLAGRAGRAVGIDLSREMLAVARANLDRAGVSNVQIRLGDLTQLPFPDASFEVAVMHHVLHYLEEPALALREAARVLVPGGALVVVDFAAHEVEELRREHAHRWLGFAPARVAQWLSDTGFNADSVQSLPGSPLTVVIWRATRRRNAGQGPGHPTVADLELAS